MKFFKLLLLILVLIFGLAGVGGYLLLKNNSGRQLLFNVISKAVGVTIEKQTALHAVLGFDTPKTYLVLFLNNTELRPGGGFIGAYAVVRLDRGVPKILKIEGSEILDNNTQGFADNPPEPISRWLKVKHWYFRDSNWSPDFASSSASALEIYRTENGIAAADIDTVIAFTPVVVQKLLNISGPISADGIEFNSQNFTEKLEYEVEYGYADRGQNFFERKNLIANVADALIAKFKKDVFVHWSDYLALGQKMLNEKQIIAYTDDAGAQEFLKQKNWTGEMLASSGDYLLWVDANLGALKTDAALERFLTYKITPTTTGLVAMASMEYKHNGKYDWRTSRYLSYSRVFVPLGSKLIKVVGADKSDSQGLLPIGQGVENGRQWFGAYVNVAPGTTGTLTFEYLLPDNIVAQAKTGGYKLLVQKQIGTNEVGLNIDLDLNGNVLKKSTDLSVDRDFEF